MPCALKSGPLKLSSLCVPIFILVLPPPWSSWEMPGGPSAYIRRGVNAFLLLPPHSRPTPTCTHTHTHTCPFSSHGLFLLTLLSQIMDHRAIKDFPALNPKDISPVSLIQQFAMDIFKCCFQLCMYCLTSLERH